MSEENKGLDLSLTFKDINFEKPLKIPPMLILELKKLCEKNIHINSYQNIDQIMEVGSNHIIEPFNYYYIILYTIKNNGIRAGYLIGNKKNMGDLLIGIWPFNEALLDITPEAIFEKFMALIKKPYDYTNISLITA